MPQSFEAGKKTTIGILFQPDEHWHVYWKNPGDSGAAPKFKFSGNAEIGEIQWPTPKRMPIAHLTNLAYEGDVAYLADVTPMGSTVESEVKLEWLVCQEECIPGFGTLRFKRAVGKETWLPADKAVIDRFQSRLPQTSSNAPIKISSAKVEGDTLAVTISGFISTPELFPVNGEAFGPAQPQFAKSSATASEGTFLIPVVPGAALPATSDFVITDSERAYEFKNIAISQNSSPSSATAPGESSNLFVIILFSFIGGVILNLMPCVFPVLSIKVFSLVKSDVTSKERTREGLLYTAGVLVTFASLGAGFLALRSAGNAVGWGFQLQSPVVVLTLAILFWMMALNFLGAFEFGTSVMNVAGRNHSTSAFATGVLSVFVAAPCTGPFMGSALGAAAVLPAASAMLIFISLGLGLAAPFLLIALVPSIGRLLPRPGAWMETFKEFLAFPLFATVLWLLWVLAQQVGSAAWQIGSLVLLALSFGIWLSNSKKTWVRTLALLFTVASIFVGARELRQTRMVAESPNQASAWKAYDKSVIEAARSAKQNVFVDFTAAWCITCQVNKKAVLDTEHAQQLFRSHNTLLVRADWTKQDPKITAALSELGRNSVPVYVFYAADGSEPKILPQILTHSIIEDLYRKP